MGTTYRTTERNLIWRIQPLGNPPLFSDEIKVKARDIALGEALKQETECQDVRPDSIARLSSKWQNHALILQQWLARQDHKHIDDLLILAWRVNRFAHYYEAELVKSTLAAITRKPTEIEIALSTAKGNEEHYRCGQLVAQHYATATGALEMLRGTQLEAFPDTGTILLALSLDCVLHAALCLDNDVSKALDLLADSMAANHLALQGQQQQHNYFHHKAERVNNGKAGAKKRHSKMAQLTEWTLEKYKAGTWKSANQAAYELTKQVLAHSKEIGANLTESNAQRTIADWIRKSV